MVIAYWLLVIENLRLAVSIKKYDYPQLYHQN